MENTETKVCSKCGLEKPLSDFYFSKSKSKYENPCKKCIKTHQLEKREEILKRKKQYRLENRDKILTKSRDYYAENKDILNKKHREYYKNNKRRMNECSKIYRIKNKDDIKIYYNNKRYQNVEFRLSILFRNRVREAIKNQRGMKAYKSMELLGCSVDECRKWLESKFISGMSWDNHGVGEGKWHIDHIIPCASFDLTKPEEQLKCFHYTNLQPLWQKDNLSKKDKIQVITSEGVFLV